MLLALPLILFIIVTFVAPLGSMFLRSLYDPLVANIMPETIAALGGMGQNGPAAGSRFTHWQPGNLCRRGLRRPSANLQPG